ncbi:MAG: ABC transporter permease [bacterium]|nr:MAG: ABC transporter permease [bacterium]
MNVAYFIAKHIAPGRTEAYARPIIRIAVISIALGLALMIISVAIVIGFKSSISNKVVGFSAPLRVVAFTNNESLEESPVTLGTKFLKALRTNPEITHIQYTAQKGGVLKTRNQIQGIILKGVGQNYDWSFLKKNLAAGHLPDFKTAGASRQVLISQKLARKLQLKVGDAVRIWFIGQDATAALGRKLTISGIYNTGIGEFDNRFLIGDLRQIQRLNGWKPDQVGSVELQVRDFKKLKTIALGIYKSIPYNLNINTIYDNYPEIFNWLNLLNTNVVVILVLMILVAGVTMVSTLFILIIERTGMVGLLKTLGTGNRTIQKIFLYKAAYIIGRGMFWGNLLGLLFYFVQYYFHMFRLNPVSYYVSYVPVELSVSNFLLLNTGTFFLCLLMLIIPSFYIMRIEPARALRYE